MKRVAIALLLVAACREDRRDARTDAPPGLAADAAASTPDATDASAVDAASPARERATLAEIVAGGAATTLAERATEPSRDFDDDLRDKVAPSPFPRVTLAKIEVSPGLHPAVVTRMLRQRFGQFRLCYERALKATPKLEGTVAVAFTIDAKGKAVAPKDGGSTVAAPPLVACVTDIVGQVAFPEPESGSVQVTYTLAFKPPR